MSESVAWTEYVSVSVGRIEPGDVYNLMYGTRTGSRKSLAQSTEEFEHLRDLGNLLGVGIYRHAAKSHELVALMVTTFITHKFEQVLIHNLKPDIHALIAKYPKQWVASENEIATSNASVNGANANRLLILYYRIAPTLNAADHQEVRELLHQKYLALCGGFNVGAVLGELWSEHHFAALTSDKDILDPRSGARGLGFSCVNDYAAHKEKRRKRSAVSMQTPCLLRIEGWEKTHESVLRRLLSYRHPIFGLTTTQKSILRAELGIFPFEENIRTSLINTHRQRIYQRLLRPEFAETWLGSELHRSRDSQDHNKRVIVDSYFRDNLHELRPYTALPTVTQ